MSRYAYSRSAVRQLNRLGKQTKRDICTIVPILTHKMVEEACSDSLKISDGARVLRETGIDRLSHNIYSINTDEKLSLVCMFQKKTCAILAINQRSQDFDLANRNIKSGEEMS